MQVSHIKISNILGIESLEIEAGKFITVSGKNGVGKTSVVEALKAALTGGHDATLLRNGSSVGEVVLVLEDGAQITKRVTATKSEQLYTDAEGRKSTRPAESIKQLVDALSVNPVEFLTVPKKQQVAALLEAMPMQADAERLGAIAGVVVDPKTASLHAMDAIEVVRKIVYDERTGLNRAAKEKQATVKQLADTLPPAESEAPAGEDEIRADLDDLEAARQAEMTRVDEKLAGLRGEADAKVAELGRQIEAIRDEFREQQILAERKKAAVNQKAAEQRASLQAQLDVINASREANARAQQTRDTIAAMTAEAEALQVRAADATFALEELEKYKASLLASLPIPGLEVRDGEIFFNGVVFERLNSAEQVKVAVELAKLRAGTLGLVCVDGIERLDPEAFAAFKEQALASGVQMVVTRVGDSPFTVESAA